MEVLSFENAVVPPAPVDYETLFTPGEADMTLQQAEKDIVEIKETLKWHARVGWGAIGLYSLVFGGFLTWCLPKELTAQKNDIVQGVQLEIGKIPVAALNKLILPQNEISSAPVSDLQKRFQEIKYITDTSISGNIIASPNSLSPVATFLRTGLTLRDDLPAPVRSEAVSALVHVEGYSAFNEDMLHQQGRLVFQDNVIEAEKDATVWPMATWLKISPAQAPFVVARDNLIRGIRQNLTGIRWLGNTFDRSVVTYDGGDLYLSSTVFKNCTFTFGNDPTSKKVQTLLEQSEGKPVTILISKNFSSI